MEISKERRERWEQNTKNDAFNRWLGPQVTAPDGTLDLEALHAVAQRYGIDRRSQYAHLNPGQVRMNLGNMLRRAVPKADYEGGPPTTPVPQQAVEAYMPEIVKDASVRDLLRLHGQIMGELRLREIVRTSNSPAGDYAELLFSMAFGWNLEGSSAAGHDATDGDGLRYQIKSRRLTKENGSRQLSFLRKLPEKKFDYLAAVLFDASYGVQRAIILPHEGLEARCRFSNHANGWLFRLEDSCWQMAGAREVTEEIRTAAAAM